ncbi:MAG TPA: hypothetical protein VF815_31470 [Myxococcaceae bacterium]|jgi:hypothetical protein
MERLLWCLAVVVAVSGCVTPRQRYAALAEESLKARTLEEAFKAPRLFRVKVGREIKLSLDKEDDLLLTSDEASSHSYYVSYYRTYAFEAVAGQSYTLTVKSGCDCLGFQKLTPVPDVYVVNDEGTLVSRLLQPPRQEEINGELVGKWEFAAEKTGPYFLVLAVDNSDPGRIVGTVVAYDPHIGKIELPLQASIAGSMAFQINAVGPVKAVIGEERSGPLR